MKFGFPIKFFQGNRYTTNESAWFLEKSRKVPNNEFHSVVNHNPNYYHMKSGTSGWRFEE